MKWKEMRMPLFSIIVPIYKVEDYIEACIKSVLEQQFADYELILVDDGSPDGCGKICDDYAEQYPQIQVVHRKNGGLSEARNSGIRAASGDYLIFLDGDDLLCESCLNALQQYFKMLDKEVDVVFARLSQFYDGRIILEDLKSWNSIDIAGKANWEVFMALVKSGQISWSSSSNIFRRAFLQQNDLMFKQELVGAEDLDFFSAIMNHASKFSLAPIHICCYRVGRVGSITTNLSARALLKQLMVYTKWHDFYKTLNMDPASKRVICNLYSGLFVKKIYMLATLNPIEQIDILDYIRNNTHMLQNDSSKKNKILAVIYQFFGLKLGAKLVLLYHQKDRNRP